MKLRRLVIPLFLVLCVLAGGSTQEGIWFNLGLQLLALAIIAWALASRPSEDLTRPSRQVLTLLGLALGLALAQLVPLPPFVWTAFPGREVLLRGYETLGYSLPWLPVSLAPFETLRTLLSWLPAAAVLIATLRIRQRETALSATVLSAVLISVLFGAMQVASGEPGDSAWYLYRITNNGAVGFFANRNHMGSLLLVSIPFGFALLASAASLSHQAKRISGMIAFGTAALLVVVVGIALNRSLAAIALVLPVVVLSSLLFPAGWRVRRFVAPLGALTVIACLLLLMNAPLAAELAGTDRTSVESRREIWENTLVLTRETFPIGIGLGSFLSAYPLTEDPAAAQLTFINHAHNDYLELLVETGLAGALLMLGFLTWWAFQVLRVWRSALSSQYARAATIASGALLAHSWVDYPLRTAALSAVFAMCIGVMAQPRRRRRGDRSDVRPTKHVVIE